MNIIPFEGSNFDLAKFAVPDTDLSVNAAALKFASTKFPVISIKGNRFHVKRDEEKSLIMRPKSKPTDHDEPATYIDVVFIRIQEAKSYYANGYVEGSDDKPTCSSSNGVIPDLAVENKQCSTCALCPHNAWGSGTDDKGNATKGKACSDVIRAAVDGSSNLDDPMLLRVPPASLKNLGELVRYLTARNVPINRLLIRVSFDVDKNGVLMFKYVGGLDDATYARVKAKENDELVLAITGSNVAAENARATAVAAVVGQATAGQKAIASAKTVQEAPKEDPEAAKKAAKAAAKAKKLEEAKAAAEAAARAAEAAAKAAEGDDDDEETATPAPAAVASTSASFNDELKSLLG